MRIGVAKVTALPARVILKQTHNLLWCVHLDTPVEKLWKTCRKPVEKLWKSCAKLSRVCGALYLY